MSVQLLDKTRKIGKLLHNNNSSKVVFNDICQVLTEILDSCILVISKKGKVLGVSHSKNTPDITELIVDEVGGFIDPMLNERLLGIKSFLPKKMSIYRHWDLKDRKSNVILLSLHRLILQVSDWEHCLYIVMIIHTISMILFYASMEQRSWDWK